MVEILFKNNWFNLIFKKFLIEMSACISLLTVVTTSRNNGLAVQGGEASINTHKNEIVPIKDVGTCKV